MAKVFAQDESKQGWLWPCLEIPEFRLSQIGSWLVLVSSEIVTLQPCQSPALTVSCHSCHLSRRNHWQRAAVKVWIAACPLRHRKGIVYANSRWDMVTHAVCSSVGGWREAVLNQYYRLCNCIYIIVKIGVEYSGVEMTWGSKSWVGLHLEASSMKPDQTSRSCPEEYKLTVNRALSKACHCVGSSSVPSSALLPEFGWVLCKLSRFEFCASCGPGQTRICDWFSFSIKTSTEEPPAWCTMWDDGTVGRCGVFLAQEGSWQSRSRRRML